MQFSVAALILLATTAVAMPAGGPGASSSSQHCGKGKVSSCCSGSKNGNSPLGLPTLTGGNCAPAALTGVGGAVPLSEACGNKHAACCTGTETGLLNVECDPIGF